MNPLLKWMREERGRAAKLADQTGISVERISRLANDADGVRLTAIEAWLIQKATALEVSHEKFVEYYQSMNNGKA